MALQNSGQISMDDIQNEFGGNNPASIDEYYKNGGLVPNSTANSSIPFSGQIKLSDFYGGESTPTNSAPSASNVFETITSPNPDGRLVTLVGSDPDNDPLTYYITENPTEGVLRDAHDGAAIGSLPYRVTNSLGGDTNQIRYDLTNNKATSDSFKYKVNDGEFDSNIATVSLGPGV